jgi:hypothetical protein
LKWKNKFPEEQIEVSMSGHRADAVRTDGMVIEFQNSSLSVEEIKERERTYGRMVWLFNGTSLKHSLRPWTEDEREYGRSSLISLRHKNATTWTFRWRHPRKHYGHTSRPTFIDLGNGVIFNLKKLHLEGGAPYGGWGQMIREEDFLAYLIKPGYVPRPISGEFGGGWIC